MKPSPKTAPKTSPGVLLGMSGGVDSSAAAEILLRQGYHVEGATLLLTCGLSERLSVGIRPRDDASRAADVCKKLGIRHHIIDGNRDFEKRIVSSFADEYFNGLTPNPCIRCNPEIKWRLLLSEADRLGLEFIATGHYARISHTGANGYTELLKGIDREKDQSYYLWQLTQSRLKRTLFPLGSLTKTDVKALASELKLSGADREESQDICFIPDGNYRDFLAKFNPERIRMIGKGNFITREGHIAGTHSGFYNFTVGQRRGLNIAMGYPVYVLEIRPETNEVVIGGREELRSPSAEVYNVNWTSIPAPQKTIPANVKIRYRHQGLKARLIPLSDSKVFIKFDDVTEAVTPGQSAVFYSGEKVLGGGIITRTASRSGKTGTGI